MVGVEALASGLPVLLSDHITGELGIFSAVEYISLKDADRWASAIERQRKPVDRLSRQKEVVEHGFDLRDTVQLLEKVYLEDVKK